MAVSREAVRDNTLGVIGNTPRVFEISLGVLYLIPDARSRSCGGSAAKAAFDKVFLLFDDFFLLTDELFGLLIPLFVVCHRVRLDKVGHKISHPRLLRRA